MLKLIEGGFYSGAHEMIVSELSDLIAKKEKAILIVPEQQTVSAESEMIDTLPCSSALYFEVTNFTRLANSVFRALGGLAKESASSAKRALIMWRAVTELSSTLETVGKDVSTGTVSKMLAAVKQLGSCGVTPEELIEASDKLDEIRDADKDARLIAKMRDLSKIASLYKHFLKEHFSDGDEDLTSAAQKLMGGDFLSGTKIYVDGFASFTEPQYTLLSALLRITDVTVSLTLPKAAADAFEYTEIKECHSRLTRLAANAGVDVKLLRTDSSEYAPCPFAQEVISLLFRSTGKAHEDFLADSDFLTVYEAQTPYEECDFIARDIKKRVMGGYKYSDFGIIARSLNAYDGILNVAFDKAKIPLFTSARSDVESFEAVKLIYSAFAAVSGGYTRRDVITYAKCSLSGVDRELVDELELYAERWQISGSRFTDGILWNMNPDGFTDRKSAYHDEKLARIDEARRAIITPLTELESAISEAKTVKDHAAALYGFMRALSLEEQLYARVRRSDVTDTDLLRVYKLMCEALDSLCEVLPDTECSAETFLSLLRIVFAESNIGRIPTYAEQVTAGSADTVRLAGKKVIYIIGAESGTLPAKIDDDAYFSDKDKRTIGELGLSIAQDTDIRSARELYYILRALSFAREKTVITYSSLDASFKPTVASEIVKRIADISHGTVLPTKIALLPSSERVYTRDYALEHITPQDPDFAAIREALCECGDEERLRISDGEIRNVGFKLSADSVNSLYGKTIPMTQSRIDTFLSCPMKYFCSSNLSLSDNAPAEFGTNNIGTFIHGILEGFFCELKSRGKAVAALTDEERDGIIKKVATAYVTSFFETMPSTTARIRHTVEKLCRSARPIIDGLCDEFSDCKYEPAFFELGIDKNSDDTPAPAVFKTDSGRELYIYGIMDRLDTYRHGEDVYVRIIDYKTGNKVFDVSDIERGENLQMFLYLKSVVDTESESFKKSIGIGEGGKMIPAGVIYVKTSLADVAIDHNDPNEAVDTVKSMQARLGMLLDDPESISAMNRKYIPVTFKKDGTLDARSQKRLYSLDGWDRINDTIGKVLSDVAEKMTSGEVEAVPLKKGGKTSACKWCEYKPFCRNAKI